MRSKPTKSLMLFYPSSRVGLHRMQTTYVIPTDDTHTWQVAECLFAAFYPATI